MFGHLCAFLREAEAGYKSLPEIASLLNTSQFNFQNSPKIWTCDGCVTDGTLET